MLHRGLHKSSSYLNQSRIIGAYLQLKTIFQKSPVKGVLQSPNYTAAESSNTRNC